MRVDGVQRARHEMKSGPSYVHLSVHSSHSTISSFCLCCLWLSFICHFVFCLLTFPLLVFLSFVVSSIFFIIRERKWKIHDVLALIVTPTRELAVQIDEVVSNFTKGHSFMRYILDVAITQLYIHTIFTRSILF